MEKASDKFKIKYSVQLKFVVTLFLLIVVLLVMLNTYPLIMSRDLVFSSKKSSMQSQASVVSSSLSALDKLTVESVSQVMQLLDLVSLSRIIITDDTGKILYDTSDVASSVGRYALLSEISRALSGEVVFYSRFSGGAFMSRAATPVVSGGTTVGAVYLYEYDSNVAELITGIQSTLRNVSLTVGALGLILILLFTRALTHRITELVRAMRIIRDGNYDFRLKTKGNDELTELGDEFNNLVQRLQSTEDLRRRFVSDASHELKTPLASIRLLSDSIVHSEGMDTKTMYDFVKDIGIEADRLQRTTEKLLYLTRLDSDIRIMRQKVDMKTVTERTLHLLAPLADKGGIDLQLELSEGCYIYAAEDDVYQIIFNLTENAIKYNHQGGMVRLKLSSSDGIVNLTVEDDGIGIPPEDIPHIFSRFYRVDKARSWEAGGSGLGLSIVQDAVYLHGGTVQVESNNPIGTKFSVSFPQYSEEGEGSA
jgi:signal transduction histidine kinase